MEPVYGEERAHGQPAQKARASEEAPRPVIEIAGGVALNLGAPEAAIKSAVAVAPSGEASVPTSSIVTSDSMFLALNPRLVSPA